MEEETVIELLKILIKSDHDGILWNIKERIRSYACYIKDNSIIMRDWTYSPEEESTFGIDKYLKYLYDLKCYTNRIGNYIEECEILKKEYYKNIERIKDNIELTGLPAFIDKEVKYLEDFINKFNASICIEYKNELITIPIPEFTLADPLHEIEITYSNLKLIIYIDRDNNFNYRIENHGEAIGNAYFHPHVGMRGELCEGDAENSIDIAISTLSLFDLVDLIFSVLVTYNEESPYESLYVISGSARCKYCDCEIDKEEDYTCEICGQSNLCEECTEEIQTYEDGSILVCYSHLENNEFHRCYDCDEYILKDENVREYQGETYCPICYDYLEKEEEKNNDEEDDEPY